MFRRLLQVLSFAVLALLCAGFVRLNATATELDLYFTRLPASVGEALVGAVLVGWLVGLAGALAWIRALAREREELRRSLKLAEGEVRTLRAVAPSRAR
jgi:uncharacterized integral membrane protein